MNREIKFRVFHKGLFTEKPSMIYDVQNSLEDYIGDENYILSQFTGLKDKNGKEIYEGDIVKFSIKGKGIDWEIGLVNFEDCCWWIGGDAPLEVEDGEVIGNVYENEELLKR